MRLRISKPQPRAIKFGEGNEITIRPLTLSELTGLFDNISPQLAGAFDNSFTADPTEMLRDEALIRQTMSLLLRAAPSVAIKAIAIAADVPDREDDVARIPLGVQLLAIAEIFETSLSDPKKVAALARRIGNSASRSSAVVSGRRH